MKEIFLDSTEAVKIAVNHYDSLKRRAVVIICPGCFMCKDAKPFQDISEDLFDYFDVITMDFRGHGRSTGLFTFTAREPNDLRCVVKFAKARYSKVAVIGFSLGGATAIIDAADYKDIQGLITVSAPTDFQKIENNFLKKEAIIPAIEKFKFGKSPNIRPGNLLLKKTKPIDVVQDISPIPIVFIAGSQDPIIYPRHAETLYEKAKEPRSIEIFENGLHAEELYLKSRDRFLEICKGYLDKMFSRLGISTNPGL